MSLNTSILPCLDASLLPASCIHKRVFGDIENVKPQFAYPVSIEPKKKQARKRVSWSDEPVAQAEKWSPLSPFTNTTITSPSTRYQAWFEREASGVPHTLEALKSLEQQVRLMKPNVNILTDVCELRKIVTLEARSLINELWNERKINASLKDREQAQKSVLLTLQKQCNELHAKVAKQAEEAKEVNAALINSLTEDDLMPLEELFALAWPDDESAPSV